MSDLTPKHLKTSLFALLKGVIMKESAAFSYPDESVTEEVSDYYYDKVLKRLPANKVILDVGCGVGTNVAKLSRFSKKVVGIDLSDERIAKAKAAYGHLPNVKFLVGDGTKLSRFKAKSFDVVFSASTMHHLPIRKTLNGFKRLLKKDGIIYIFDVYCDFYFIRTRIYTWFAVLFNKGPVYTTKLFFKMLNKFSSPEAVAHRKEDRARMKKWRRYTFPQIKYAYTSELPGAEVKVIRPRYCVWWQKKLAK